MLLIRALNYINAAMEDTISLYLKHGVTKLKITQVLRRSGLAIEIDSWSFDYIVKVIM